MLSTCTCNTLSCCTIVVCTWRTWITLKGVRIKNIFTFACYTASFIFIIVSVVGTNLAFISDGIKPISIRAALALVCDWIVILASCNITLYTQFTLFVILISTWTRNTLAICNVKMITDWTFLTFLRCYIQKHFVRAVLASLFTVIIILLSRACLT